MELRKYNFDELNEADVREEIIAPLLRELNYSSGTENNIIREQPLKYPYSQLGRKKPNKDPLLRGKADYICEIVNGPRWTIEAKAPSVDISPDDIDQAYSYAIHPEIRATYFCVANGKKFIFFQTDQGPNAKPSIETSYEKLNEDFETINNLIGPEALICNHGKIKIDVGKPLGKGLRSIGRITNGFIKYTNTNIPIPALLEMITPIKYGSIERDKDNNLLAYIEVISPFQSLQELNEKLGLDKMELLSTASVLSIDARRPTQFESTQNIILPQGLYILDLNSWKKNPLPMNIHCEAKTIAKGYLRNNMFSGEFQANLIYKNINQTINLKGKFEIFIN
ncbi:MAG: type I restriction enzyme HsdR N-terminal domain-containing protein [Candidatus Omnitrophota bacterium]